MFSTKLIIGIVGGVSTALSAGTASAVYLLRNVPPHESKIVLEEVIVSRQKEAIGRPCIVWDEHGVSYISGGIPPCKTEWSRKLPYDKNNDALFARVRKSWKESQAFKDKYPEGFKKKFLDNKNYLNSSLYYPEAKCTEITGEASYLSDSEEWEVIKCSRAGIY